MSAASSADGAVENTLALIKPNAFDSRNEIISKIKENGFEIIRRSELTLSEEYAMVFYEEHKDRPFYGELVEFMISGPIVALQLRRANAVLEWRTLMGPTNIDEAKKSAPTSIRALFGKNMTENAAHGSDSTSSAERELDFFFGPDGVIGGVFYRSSALPC